MLVLLDLFQRDYNVFCIQDGSGEENKGAVYRRRQVTNVS